MIHSELSIGLCKCVQIVGWRALPGAGCRRGKTCAKGHVGLVVPVATAYHREHPVTKSCVPAITP